MKSVEPDKIVIISDTKNALNKIECKSIGTNNDWTRNCPRCNALIVYASKKSKNRANRQNSTCFHCGGLKAIDTRIHRKNLYGHVKSEKYKKHMSRLHSGHNNPFYGKKHSNTNLDKFSEHSRTVVRTHTWKRNISKALRLYLVGYYNTCNFNKIACLYFEWLEKWNGWDGYYATKNKEYLVKELGYWVDYYEPNENLIIEWDEPRHYDRNGNLKPKDVFRMNEIKSHLNCRFFRYNQKTHELKEW